ncbi:uncharacterized protein LOC135685817 isoform X2 [Rhopilema esculentum]|uniref:uncharacterized protein LOC135685817 isoform X2 n=1 Tax=Rhopilema esculentum TaxID=499914 RepID=UPI0031CE83B7
MSSGQEGGLLMDNMEKGGEDRTKLQEILSFVNPGKSNAFWKDVQAMQEESEKSGKVMEFKEAIDLVRAKNICIYFERKSQDPVVKMMTDWYAEYELWEEDLDRIRGFEKQISKLAVIIIDEDYSKTRAANKQLVDARQRAFFKYSTEEFAVSINSRNVNITLLELCATDFYKPNDNKKKQSKNHGPAFPSFRRDFFVIAKCIVDNDRKVLNESKALELALESRYDKLASLMIRMSKKVIVRSIFEHQGPVRAKIKFADIIKDPSMKRTVVEVLNSTVNRHWPLNPGAEDDDSEVENLHVISDDPVRYHFHFQILDGDQQGRPPKRKVKKADASPSNAVMEKDMYKENVDFDHASMSCLQILCNSHHKKAVNHPTVKMLSRIKWDLYAKYYIWFHFGCFFAYLVILATSLMLAATSKHPTQYHNGTDKFRAFCECLTIICTLVYFVVEVDQLKKEGFKLYICSFFNWVDFLGILGVLLIIPLRYARVDGQWIIASLAYILNFLRIYKYFPAWELVGVYSKTLAILFKKHLTIFLAVYLMVFLTFAGATILSLRSVVTYDDSAGFKNTDVSGLGDVFFRGVKSLVQAEAFASTYTTYGAFSTIVILCSMFIMMVVMINILIAQLGNSYGAVQKEARNEFYVAKALFIAKLDNSFFRFWNTRIKYYKPGAHEHRKKEIRELVAKWKELEEEVQED